MGTVRDGGATLAPLALCGPFASAAHELRAHGLAVVPLAGTDGKKPSVTKFTSWRHRPGRAFVDKLVEKNPTANVGIVCGPLSGITVVDVDDPDQIDDMIRMCGDTPLQVETPRGGRHLYYRHNGEACPNVRKRHGLNIDLKGKGGVVSAPPSVKPNGRTYGLLSGSWDDLERLPRIKPGVPWEKLRTAVRNSDAKPAPSERHGDGGRNTALFDAMRQAVRQCSTQDEAFAMAREINSGFNPPLPDTEVIKTAASAWRYQEEGRNWCHGNQGFAVSHDEYDALRGDPLILLMELRRHHWGRNFILANALAANFGWGPNRLRAARKRLVEDGLIRCVHEGGRGPKDPPVYGWAKVSGGDTNE